MPRKRKIGGRSTSGYNLFCSTLKHTGVGIGEFGRKWRALSANEKQEWNKKTNKEIVEEKMTERQKIRFFKKHLDNIKYSCAQLEKINVNTSGLCLYNGVVHLFGSEKTVHWMEDNHEFQQQFAVASYAKEKVSRTENNRREKLRKVVQELFNTKYAECFGITQGKVQYKSKTFCVEGLPDGIPFSKPSQYGIAKMRKILGNKDKITFRLLKKAKQPEKISQDETNGNLQHNDEVKLDFVPVPVSNSTSTHEESETHQDPTKLSEENEISDSDDEILDTTKHCEVAPKPEEPSSSGNADKFPEYSATKRKRSRLSFPRKKITKWGYMQW